MPNKCVAPKCDANYKELKKNNSKIRKRKVYSFPNDALLRKKWKNAAPRKNWSPTKNSVLCENHFLPNDFKTERIDNNFFFLMDFSFLKQNTEPWLGREIEPKPRQILEKLQHITLIKKKKLIQNTQ